MQLTKIYFLNLNTTLHITPGLVGYELPKEDFSYGVEYTFRDNFTIGFSSERGNYTSLKFIYKNNPLANLKKFTARKSYPKEVIINIQNLIKSLKLIA